MKKVYSLLVAGTILCGTLVSVHADTTVTATISETHHVIATGNTLPPSTGTGMNYKNRGQAMKATQEALKQKREEMKKQLEEMKKGKRTGTGRTQTGTVLTTEQVACARAAIAKRESGILSAFTTFSTSTNSAFVARAAALDTAWTTSGSTDRKTAINTAWMNWKTAINTARNTEKTSRKNAWSVFKTEIQTCKVPESSVDGENAKLED